MLDHQTQNQKEPSLEASAVDNWHSALLRWLSTDEKQAEQRYQSLRRKLITIFAGRGASSFFVEEMADETLERAGRRLAAGEEVRHSEPMVYLHGIAKNVLHEYWRKQQVHAAREIPLDDVLSVNPNLLEFNFQPHIEQEEKERLLKCLDKYLSSLLPEDEALLRSCYQDNPHQQAANRRAEAKRLNLTEGGLRATLYRICQTLKRKVRACVERGSK